MDEYFSGEPIHDVTQFYSFDSLPQPIMSEEIPTSTPLSPPESLPSPEVITNGEKEEMGEYFLIFQLYAYYELLTANNSNANHSIMKNS